MGHSHDHSHRSIGNIRVAFFLNLAFTILEIFGGLWTNSMAILSDALHDLGDSLALGLSWHLERKSLQRRDARYSFGYRRFSLLAALINSVVLITGSLFIISENIPRLIEPEHSNARGMLLFAVIGILVNGAAALRLRGGRSMNERMVSWHLLEDVLGWVAVLIVSVVLLFRDIHILDPILSMLIVLYVLYNVARNLKQTMRIFLQRVPDELSIEQIERELNAIDHVQEVHHTHAWSLDGERHVMTVHLVVDRPGSLDDLIRIKASAKQVLKDMAIDHATVEIEFEGEECYMDEEGVGRMGRADHEAPPA